MADLPPKDYVMGFLQRAKALSGDWHDSIKEWRRLYDGKHYDAAPKPGESQYADPSFTNTVDLGVGVLLGNNIDWRASGWTSSYQEEMDTSRIEKYLAGTLDINSERAEYHIPYELLMNFVRDGAGVLYTCWDPQRSNRAMRKMTVMGPDNVLVQKKVYLETPILVQVIDPLNIHLIPGGEGRWTKIIRQEKMTVFDIETLYGVPLDDFKGADDQQKMLEKVEFTDFWEYVQTKGTTWPDTRWKSWYADRPLGLQNCVMAGDQIIRPLRLMPGYDDLPYTLGFFKPVSRENAKDWGHSLIPPMISSVAMLEKAVNRRQRAIDIYSALPIVSKTRDGRQVQVDPGIGSHVSLTLEEDIGFPQWPGSPPDVDKQMGFMQSRSEQSSFPEIMYGSSTGRMAGYAISMLTDQARIRLTQPAVHLELMLTRWARRVLRLTKNFAGDAQVRVYGRMRGRDFNEQVDGSTIDGYQVKAIVKPVFPNEQAKNVAMATQTAGILTRRTIMERYLGIEQPEDEDRRRMQEMVRNHPLVQQYALISAFKEMAEEGDEAAGMALQSILAQQQSNNPDGRPNQPSDMQQFQGTPSPNGQLQDQEQGGMPPGQSAEDQMGQMAGMSPQLQGGVK